MPFRRNLHPRNLNFKTMHEFASYECRRKIRLGQKRNKAALILQKNKNEECPTVLCDYSAYETALLS